MSGALFGDIIPKNRGAYGGGERMKYAVLLHPGHARVYLEDAERIALRELEAMVESAALGEVSGARWGGKSYLLLQRDHELSQEELVLLARFSGFFALFEERDGWLRPVEPPVAHVFPEKLNTILKYNGKTSERFTRLLDKPCKTSLPPGRSISSPLIRNSNNIWEKARTKNGNFTTA